MNFWLLLLLSICMNIQSAEETISNAMQGVECYDTKLNDAALTLLQFKKNKTAFFDLFSKGQYLVAGNYLHYLTIDEQSQYKQILLEKALEKKDLDLLSFLDDFDANLLSKEEKKLLEEPHSTKRRKINEYQTAHHMIDQFDIARAIADLTNIPEIQLKRSYTKIIAAIALLTPNNKLAAVKYIAEFGPIALLTSLCADTTIDMVEVLTHVCCTGRIEAVYAILAATKELLKVTKHEGEGEIRLKPLRHKRLQPLFTAYRHSQYAIVETLVQAYPCLLLYSCDDDVSHTIFYEAMIQKDYAFIKKLLSFYPMQDRSQKDYSVLQVATAHKDIALIRQLLLKDFLPEKLDFFKLGCTEHFSPWILAALNQDVQILTLFIEVLVTHKKGNKKFKVQTSDIVRALGAAVFKKDKNIIDLLHDTFPKLIHEELTIPGYFDRDIIEFILQNNFVCYDQDGTHFINAALSLGYLDIIERLIETSYNFKTIRNKNRESFFQRACSVGNISIIEQMSLVFSVETELRHVDSNRHIAFNEAMRDAAIIKVLVRAAMRQKASQFFCAQIVNSLLKAKYIDDQTVLEILSIILNGCPNIFTHNIYTDIHSSLLHTLCIYRLAIAQLWEPELTAAIKNDPKLLHVVCRKGNLDTVKWVVKVDPQSTTKIDESGNTALHYACQSNNADARAIVDFLCTFDSNLIEKRNNSGHTSLHTLVDEAGKSKKKFTDILQLLEKIELLLRYDGNILGKKCEKFYLPIHHYILSASFLPDFLYALLELYQSRNTIIEKINLPNVHFVNALFKFLNYLEIAKKPTLSFAELDTLFHVSNSYQEYADELTPLGVQYAMPEFILATDAFRSTSFQNDLLFLFQEVPLAMGITFKITKKELKGAVLFEALSKLRNSVIDCLRKNPNDEAFKAVCQWLNRSRTVNKLMSRIRLLFSPAQIMLIIIDQLQSGHDISQLLAVVAQHFNLKNLVDGDGNTLLHYALRYYNSKAVCLLCTISKNILQQNNKGHIAPMDLLADSPYVLQQIVEKCYLHKVLTR